VSRTGLSSAGSTGSARRSCAVVRPEEVWVADITYIHLQSTFVYLAVLMDVFTRAILGWHPAPSQEHLLAFQAEPRIA
jgi:putative transposase